MKNKVLAWHFIRDDSTIKTTSLKRPIKVFPGQVLRYRGRVEPCKRGLHASIRALDALRFAYGHVVCRVECSDRIMHHGSKCLLGEEKIVCGRRKVLWMLNTTRALHEFSIWSARHLLELLDNPDPRSLEALRVKELWLDGKATDEELKKACNSAWDASFEMKERAAWAPQLSVKKNRYYQEAILDRAARAANKCAKISAPIYTEIEPMYKIHNDKFEEMLLNANNKAIKRTQFSL